MEIRINKEVVDFTLEHERALGEVVDGIQDWLGTNGFTITGIKLNDTELTFASRLEWQDEPVEEVDSLDISAHHPMDLALDKLVAVVQYLQLIAEEADPESPVTMDLLKGLDDVSQMIDEVFPYSTTSTTTFGSQFRTLAEKTRLLDGGPVSTQDFDAFIAYTNELVIVLHARIREISDPATELKTLAPSLKEMIDRVGDVAVLLQTGRDQEAMTTLLRLLEILQKLVRVIHYLTEKDLIDLGIIEIEGEGISDFASGLNGFLRELSEAMEASDTILIGDLLEYEIAPKLISLLASVEEVV